MNQAMAEQTRAIEALLADAATRDSVAFCKLYRPCVTHPTRGVVQFVPWVFQAEYMRALDAGGPVLSVKPRQCGYSTTVMIQKLARCQTPGRTVLVVSRKEATAKELLRIARQAASSCNPPFPVALTVDNTLELGFANGSRILAESASENAGRTTSASDVVFDEFAYLPWQAEMWQSVRPTVSRSGNVAVLSSPSLEGDLFHSLSLQAQVAGSEWRYFHHTWRDVPEYDEAWYARERPQYTGAQWGEEFEGQFGSSSEAVFRAEYLDAALERGASLCSSMGTEQSDRKGIALGADVSGEGRDQSVIVYTTEAGGLYCPEVYGAWDVLPAPILQGHMEAAQAHFRVPLWIDQTGIGWGIRQNLTCESTGVVFTGGQTETHDAATATWHVARTKLVTNAILLFEQGQVAIPPGQEQLVMGLRSYRWDKRAGVNADYVDALLLALWAATQAAPADFWLV